MQLAFDDVGRGPGVVLIHGHPFDRSLWQPQVAALAGEFRVVVADLRGFGQSPATGHSVTMRQYAADVEDLLSTLRVDRPVVVGLSMGGLVAMDLVTTHPGRYAGLGLVTPTAEPVTVQERVLRNSGPTRSSARACRCSSTT